MTNTLNPYPKYEKCELPWLDSLPRDWSYLRGKSVFNCIDIRSKTGEEELLTVSAAHGVIPRSRASVTMFKAKSYVGHKLCWPGDLVVNSLWAWMQGLGFSEHRGLVSSAYSVYRPREHYAKYSRFFHYLLRSAAYKWELQTRSKGVWLSRLQLLDSAFLDMPILLPSCDDLAAIARFLDHMNWRIDRFIRAKNKIIALLNEQKQAIIHRAVTRGLDPNVSLRSSGIAGFSEIPKHWEVLALKRVLRRLIDCEHKTAPVVDHSEYHVVRTTAIRHGRLQMHGTYTTTKLAFGQWTRRGTPEPEDVMFTREAPAGEACVVPTDLNLCLGQRTVLMKPRKERINAQFLVHLIYAGPPRAAIMLASQGSTVGHFNMSDIGVLPIFLPPIAEQVAIVDAIAQETRGLDEVIHRTEREIELIREYRTRLISDVVTGKLDVREVARDLPAMSEDTGSPAEAFEGDEEELEETSVGNSNE